MARPAACAVVISNDRTKVLAVSRYDNPNDWGYPADRMDSSDNGDFTQTAIRGLAQETGHRVLNNRRSAGTFVFGRRAVRSFCLAIVWSESALYSKNNLTENDESPPPFASVRWRDPADLETGTFGDYNRALHAELRRIGMLQEPGAKKVARDPQGEVTTSDFVIRVLSDTSELTFPGPHFDDDGRYDSGNGS